MKFGLFILILFFGLTIYGQSKPALRYADKIRINDALNISKQYGEKIWKGYNAAPFAIILVSDSIEFLINHPYPSNDFILSGYDTLLGTSIYYRKAIFSSHFLATFPAVNGLSCIVVGTPENTNKNSTEWIVTLLHEHFHQFQNIQPDYYESVNGLGLSGGDETGMWMLNYPFPYNNIAVIKQYKSYSKALYRVVTTINEKKYNSNLKQYFSERKAFKQLLTPAEYRYFSFQIWQEGLARHTEYAFLELLTNYSPSQELSSLPDFISFSELKMNMFKNETENLLTNKLNEAQRVCFYSTGFAEGLILNKLNKKWREKYMIDKFFIEHYSNRFQ